MARLRKKLIVVGDRVLIKQDRPEDRTEVGLYLVDVNMPVMDGYSFVADERDQQGRALRRLDP